MRTLNHRGHRAFLKKILPFVFFALFAVQILVLTGAELSTAQDEATPTPYVMPTLPSSPTPSCPNTQRNRLIVYERGRVTNDDPSPLNLRAGPSTSFDILNTLPTGTLFFVLEGPRCSQRYAWYRIEYNGAQGWIAEGDSQKYFVEPYLPG